MKLNEANCIVSELSNLFVWRSTDQATKQMYLGCVYVPTVPTVKGFVYNNIILCVFFFFSYNNICGCIALVYCHFILIMCWFAKCHFLFVKCEWTLFWLPRGVYSKQKHTKKITIIMSFHVYFRFGTFKIFSFRKMLTEPMPCYKQRYEIADYCTKSKLGCIVLPFFTSIFIYYFLKDLTMYTLR